MVKSKQTEVAAALIPYGIKESTVAPKKIVVRKSDEVTKWWGDEVKRDEVTK